MRKMHPEYGRGMREAWDRGYANFEEHPFYEVR
jgi:hypothetical protein